MGPKTGPGAIRLPRIDLPLESLKTCSECKQDLPRSTFYRDKGSPDGRAVVCRSCRTIADRIYRSENHNALTERKRRQRADRPDYFRDYQLKWSHGITLTEYNEILAKQDGGCAICHGPQVAPHKHLCVDHCHRTGRIRGLLCSPCNKSLGLFKDDPKTLMAAARYLGAD